MAVGFNFLQKTSSVQGKFGASKAAAPRQNNNQNVSQLLSQNPQQNKTSGANKEDMASMSTSDLIKHVYNNNGGDVNIKNHKGEDKTEPDNVSLPLNVEYNNQNFSSHGKNFEDMVKEISLKTHDSTCKVESELKRKYTTITGGSLNMNA